METNIFEQIFWGNSIKQYCLCIGIVLLGLLFRKLISRVLSKLFFKVFNKFADASHSETFINLLVKPIAFFISVFSLFIASKQLTHPFDVALRTYRKAKSTDVFTLGELSDKIFLFLIIFSIFRILLRIIDFIAYVLLIKASKTENKSDDQLVPFLKELLKFLVSFIGFFVLLGYVFEVNAVSLITGLGIGGIAIAMAAKDSLENLLGSFLIFMDKPFTVGDTVKVDGIEGTIERVGFRSTVLRSPDKTTYVIPNRSMIDGVLENVTIRNARRVKFDLGITYETEAAAIKKIITEINAFLKEYKGITDSTAALDSLGDFAVNIQVIYLVPTKKYAEFLRIKEDVYFKMLEIVQQNGSDMAYPTQRTVSDEVVTTISPK